MKRFIGTLCLLMIAALTFGQNAKVQVIHNSPLAGTSDGPVVDIYVNGGLLPQLTAVPFRAATPFLDVPAGVDIQIEVKPSPSTPADPAVGTFDLGQLDDGGTYVVAATGILGDPTTPFGLSINGSAKEAAADPATVEFAVLHGSPDAPNVDVDARLVGNLISDLAFGSYSGYLPVPPALYYIDVRAAGDPNIVATFQADLSGLAGGAATVFASGLLGNTPAFGLFAALPDGTVVELPASPVARVQLIHNSPEPAVDVYANGDLLLGGFEFRTATPFIFLPAGVAIDLAVVPAGGDPATMNVYTGGPITLDNGATYVVTAGGIVGNALFPFELQVQAAGQEVSANAPNVDFTILHGSPGAPDVNIDAIGVVSATLATGLSYGEYTGYISVPAAPYFVIVEAFGAEFIYYADLTGLEGGAATLFASGLLTGNPAFGVFAALPDGTVIELPAVTEFANVQIIHNSPTPAAASVDVYLNGALAIEDLNFREATEYLELPAGLPLNIGVAPAGSTSVTDTVANFTLPALDADANYIATAGGILGDPTTPFTLQILANSQLAANQPGNVDVVVLHSSPGAPAVDVDARLVATLVEDLAYGEYSNYIPVPSDDYFIDIRAAGSPDIVATFLAPLSIFEDEALTVFASGILGGTPAFGLFAADVDGVVYELDPVSVARFQVIHNAVAPAVDIYFNDEPALENFEFRTATGYDFVVAAEPINVKVVPTGGNPATDAVFDADVTFPDNAGSYIVVATGIPGDLDAPFTLAVYDGGREAAESAGVDLLLYHGAPNAPAVDVLVSGTTSLVFENVAYGEFSNDYVNVPAASYELDVTPTGINDQVVATYLADVTSLEGGAAVVFASGLLGDDEPTFAVWVALPDGTTFPLDLLVATNDLGGILESMTVFPNPLSDQGFIRFELERPTDVQYELYDAQGRLVLSRDLGTQFAGANTIEIQAGQLPAGTYYARLRSNEGTAVRSVIITR